MLPARTCWAARRTPAAAPSSAALRRIFTDRGWEDSRTQFVSFDRLIGSVFIYAFRFYCVPASCSFERSQQSTPLRRRQTNRCHIPVTECVGRVKCPEIIFAKGHSTKIHH